MPEPAMPLGAPEKQQVKQICQAAEAEPADQTADFILDISQLNPLDAGKHMLCYITLFVPSNRDQ